MKARPKVTSAFIVKNARAHYNQAIGKKDGKGRENIAEQLRWIALAIGCQPDDPPAWAIEACIKFRKEAEQAYERGANKAKYGSYLDKIIETFLSHDLEHMKRKPSLKSTIENVIQISTRMKPNEDRSFDALYKAIFRAWKDEAQDYEIDPVFGLPKTPRFQRILINHEGRKWGKPTYDAAADLWRIGRKEKNRQSP